MMRFPLRLFIFLIIQLNFLPVVFSDSQRVTNKTQVILVDDFNSYNTFINPLGGILGGCNEKDRPGVCLISYDSTHGHALGNTGSSLKLSYDVTAADSYSYFFIQLGRMDDIEKLNLREYDYLSFWMKGETGGENFRIELHQDVDGDGRYAFGKDVSFPINAESYIGKKGLTDRWQKVVIPLKDFHGIRNLSRICEIVFVFDKESGTKKGAVYVDDLIFGKMDLDKRGNKCVPIKESFKINGVNIKDGFVFDRDNTLEIESKCDVAEAVWFEISNDGGRSWRRIASAYNNGTNLFQGRWNTDEFNGEEGVCVRAVAVTPFGRMFTTAGFVKGCSIKELSCMSVLDDLEKQAFLYFLNNQNLKTGLFSDTAGGRDSSIAVTGFGLAALCIGAEHGWIDKDQAKRRVLRALRTFSGDSSVKEKVTRSEPDKKQGSFFEEYFSLKIASDLFNAAIDIIEKPLTYLFVDEDEKKESRVDIGKAIPAVAENKNGFFYHFIKCDTAERTGKSEISTVDSAILFCGMLTAGEYFGGEIRELAEGIYKRADWMAFCDEKIGGKTLFLMGWTPENGFLEGRWDFFSEETIIVTLLAAGSPANNISGEAYYGWKRQKGNYAGGNPFVYSWYGALFTYQYANVWFDFRDLLDRDGNNWFNNSADATLANRRFCVDEAGEYKTYGMNCWGISSCYTPQGYSMKLGSLPNGDGCPIHDGTVSPPGAASSINVTPFYAMSAIQYMLQKYPDLKGRYGLKNSFNLDKGFYSPTDYGLDLGTLLLSIENFKTGFIWKHFMKNRYIVSALAKTGFVKDDRYLDGKLDAGTSKTGIDKFIAETNLTKAMIDDIFNKMEVLVNADDEKTFKLFIANNNAVYKKAILWLNDQRPSMETEFLKFLALLRMYRFKEADKQFGRFKKSLKTNSKDDKAYCSNVREYIERFLSLNMVEDYTAKLISAYYGHARKMKNYDIDDDINGFADIAFNNGRYPEAYEFYKTYLNSLKDKLSQLEFIMLCDKISGKFYNIERYDYSSDLDLLEADYLMSKNADEAYNADFIMKLMNRYYDLERYSAVTKLADRFLKKYPNSDTKNRVVFMRGMCSKRMKRYDYAKEDFREIEMSGREDEYLGKALLMSGEINMILGQSRKALKYFDRVIEKFKGSEMAGAALYNKGVVYYGDGNYSEAEKIFTAAAAKGGAYKDGAMKNLERIRRKK